MKKETSLIRKKNLDSTGFCQVARVTSRPGRSIGFDHFFALAGLLLYPDRSSYRVNMSNRSRFNIYNPRQWFPLQPLRQDDSFLKSHSASREFLYFMVFRLFLLVFTIVIKLGPGVDPAKGPGPGFHGSTRVNLEKLKKN